MSDSRISGLHRQTLNDRIDALRERGWLSPADADMLRNGRHVITPAAADRIIENVFGVFGLPFAIAPNFIVNHRDYIVPMVVEEPSIVAATSNAARQARVAGGFTARCGEALLIGQIHVADVADIPAAVRALERAKADLIAAADAVHPNLTRRGGGVRDIELRRLRLDGGSEMIAAHLLVDTCDAMGANLVNTLCEALAPQVAAISGGTVRLRILSNLADRSLVVASVRYPLADLATGEFAPEAVRDGIVAASAIAAADPYRAATHNKGIMNGIDALAVATGNDWRAVEAGAHAFAARGGTYGPLATWQANAGGDLVGELRLPLKVGIVGGTLSANPAATLALRMTGVETARELAELMAAVGLAQNYAALRALATRGIQQGHMRLHARSQATASVMPPQAGATDTMPGSRAAGKVILLGEHGVVFGKRALALPIADAVSATASRGQSANSLAIPDWHVEEAVVDRDSPMFAGLDLILDELGLRDECFAIEVRSRLPRAMGLGSSAAVAVAIVRALAAAVERQVDDARVNAIAFACEKLAHGTPSGIDNTLATYARPLLFRNADGLELQPVELAQSPPVVIGCGLRPASTKVQVAAVRARRARSTQHFDAVFDAMDALSRDGAAALAAGDYVALGDLMNVCQGLLNAIGVSTPELEHMVAIARAAGAAGAKLTGSGGGGSIVAICPGDCEAVRSALESAGFTTLTPGREEKHSDPG